TAPWLPIFQKHCHSIQWLLTIWETSIPRDPFIARLYQDHLRLRFELLFGLLALMYEREKVFNIWRQVCGTQGTKQANSMELLETMLNRHDQGLVLPLLNRFLLAEPATPGRADHSAPDELLVAEKWLNRVVLYDGANHEREGGGMAAQETNAFEIISQVSFLSKVPLFQDVPADYLAIMAELFDTRVCLPGEIVFQQGDQGDAFFIVQSGLVAVTVQEKEVGRFGPGAGIGEMSLLDNEPRSASCAVLEETRLLRLSSRSFSHLLETFPSIGTVLLRSMSQRLRAAERKV
ncbi:MAG: cyclic nucleotide-binding domain-containing protein, partial [Magnetococcales bacterium]|nr:cyclic nucleotide-binding domain-containing protein [Magnetococcales bacterium]